MASFVEPIEVEVQTAGKQLRIHWSDGHQSIYALHYLRGFCPCAVCQGHGGAWNFQANTAPDIADIHEVGNYALGIGFSDGHSTGIYTFDILRELCPCSPCQTQQGPEHPIHRMPTQLAK